ncbi:MAG TPA: hypothetical protein VEM41_07190 [Actinomycetota bacterium]|nr:hypothetical protein [Actinomycetota bacterium]
MVLLPRDASTPLACETTLSSLPPAGCSGVPIGGYDFGHLPGVTRAGGAWWTSRPWLLVGTWDGRVLTVTRPPAPPGGRWREPPRPAGCTGRATPAAAALAKRIASQRARLHMLTLTRCGTRVWVLVAVADAPTIAYVHRHFGERVVVSGWLRRR